MPEINTAPELTAVETSSSGHGEHLQQHPNGQPPWARVGGSLGSIVAGGALAAFGVRRRGAGGAAMAAAGGLLALRGIRKAVRPHPVHVERSFTINRPVHDVFSYFRNFENLPRFMQHLKSVEPLDERRSHWVAYAPFGIELEWDAELTDEAGDRYIVWQSLPGALIPNRGAVEFQPASHYHGGTEISVTMDYSPPAGRGGALFARVFGREPGVQIREDLRRLKQLLEAGEIPTTEGQPHGRRSGLVRVLRYAQRQPGGKREPQRERTEHPWAMSS